MYGLHGKILKVDLTDDNINEIKIPDEYAKKYIGGKGLGLRYLLDTNSNSNYEPLSADNPLIYMTGPFTGFGIPGSGRHVVLSKSPLSGFLAESYAGGYFGTYLKRTGFDGIIITGKADVPKFLIATAENQSLEKADKFGLWGCSPAEVEDKLIKKYGDIKVSAIGIAGENLVKFSSLINDKNRANGRCGLGAVSGSKKLKAVVVGGTLHAELHSEEDFKKSRIEYISNLKNNSGLANTGKFGTPNLVETLNNQGILPTKNFRSGQFDSAKSISGETLCENFLTGRDSCSYCPVRCKRIVSGSFGGEQISPAYGGPEYETIASFGSLLENKNLESICLANQKCNQYGLDTISTGNVIAFAMEASETGLIEDKIQWGDSLKIIELVNLIAKREGVGDSLAEGVKRFSEKVGGESFAQHSKGLETPLHEPRGKKGLGISYAMSPRGCSHLEGFHDTMVTNPDSSPELSIVEPYSRLTLENKVRVVKTLEDVRSFTNSLIQCVFTVSVIGSNYNINMLLDMLYAITGEKIDTQGMLDKGALFYNMAREFSVRHGLKEEHDILPDRFMIDPLYFDEQPTVLSKDEFEKSKEEYYLERGWDSSGRPKGIH
jgi:aldehyde:ferredoxin oxidoreductase